MSTLPQFIKDQKESVVWKHLTTHKHSWLENRLRSLLKGESIAVRYTYGYLRYVDKDNRGFAYPAQATIARAVRVSPRHVIRCLARLEEMDLILRGKKAGHSYYIFTLPPSFKKTKSPLELNLEAISEEVKALKDRALKPHLDLENAQKEVTSPGHTNRIKIKNKIESPPSPQSTKESSKEKAPLLPSNPLTPTSWYDWMEENIHIPLTPEEREEKEKKQKEILSARIARFPNLPVAFLCKNTDLLALAWVLRLYRQMTYEGTLDADLGEIL